MKVIVVMPAYNAARTLAKTIADIPFGDIHELILVDDASLDQTYELAHEIAQNHPALTMGEETAEGQVRFTALRLPENRGYGGNQKQCYNLALARGADVVIMLHPDYQYDATLIAQFVSLIRNRSFDVVLGSRIRTWTEAQEGGMPLYKYYGNRLLSAIQNQATGLRLSEWHTGMRAYTRNALERIGYERFSDDFVFDSQLLLACVAQGCRIGDMPVPVRYHPEASSIGPMASIRYGILTLIETLRFWVRRESTPPSSSGIVHS